MIGFQVAGVTFQCPKADPVGPGLEWPMERALGWWDMMRGDGSHTAFFHFNAPEDVHAGLFIETISTAGVVPWFGGDGLGPCFFFMFDDVSLATTRMHFCVAKRLWGARAAAIGRAVVRHLLSMRTNDGRRIFQALLGETPADNRPAIAYALRCGFKRYGIIPRGFYIQHRKTYVDRVLTMARIDEGDE